MRDNLDDLLSGLAGAPITERRQPFKFLDPYGLDDRTLFFGRETETTLLYAQFFKSRLTLVYGESGTGKTSLIECGLRTQIPLEDMLFIPVRTAFDPATALRQALLYSASVETAIYMTKNSQKFQYLSCEIGIIVYAVAQYKAGGIGGGTT